MARASAILALSLAASAAVARMPPARAAIPSAPLASERASEKRSLADRLAQAKRDVVDLEGKLLDGLHSNHEAKDNVKRIQALLGLQKHERLLATQRIAEIEKTVRELETRRSTLRERILVEQAAMRKNLVDMHVISEEEPASGDAMEAERIAQPRAKVLENLVRMGLREMEALRIDLEDAQSLEATIGDERAQLDVTMQELAESEGILELNRQLQIDLIRKTHDERVSQLDQYRKVKHAEAQVGDMIRSFNSRMELQEVQRSERAANRAMAAMSNSLFAKLKGRLPLPVGGKILGKFGKYFDAVSKLTLFKKGVDIAAGAGRTVQAITRGKIAYAGELTQYGRMVIVDHGDHFYSIMGNLGELAKKAGDAVEAGEAIGRSDSAGTPVYFEIRARNIPVNPLQWVAASL